MNEITWLLYGTSFVAISLLYLWIGKKIYDFRTPYKINEELTENDNPAVGFEFSGYLLGLTAIICGTFLEDGEDRAPADFSFFGDELISISIYFFIGLICLSLASICKDKLILHKFCLTEELIENSNRAVGTALGATYFGAGLVIAGAIHGASSPVSVIIWFLVSQVIMGLYVFLFQKITPYDIHHELKENNLAAGLSLGGHMVGFSMILMKACSMNSGQLLEWSDRIWHFGYYTVAGVILLQLVRVINDKVFLPDHKLNLEISEDKNINAGWVDSALSISVGAILTFCL